MDFDMSTDERMFFDGKPVAFQLYESFVEKLFEKHRDIGRKVCKTQISFTNPRVFSCISFAKIRKASDRPSEYMVVTLGLHRRLQSPRIDVSTEPYPGRWTHHILIENAAEMDEELMFWVEEAYQYAKSK